jgi:septal ring factor EnvC (AmiA/AmiB activator)
MNSYCTRPSPVKKAGSNGSENRRRFSKRKSDVIRGLHQKMQEMQASSAGDNYAKAQELQRQQAELEEGRRQLDEDKQDLMTQMRTMEMELSRDRADIARQRSELQRLETELNREIDVATRDPVLHERLADLRRCRNRAFPLPLSPPPRQPNASAASCADSSAARRNDAPILRTGLRER